MMNFLRERLRARAIDELGILGMKAEPGLQRFVDHAASAFAAPVALLNVIRGDRLWVTARTGLAADCTARRESLCHHVLDGADILEVCDAADDPAFRALPAVSGAMHLRYYIGAPLRIAGKPDIGALCVIDTRPREPASTDQRAYLAGLARQAADALQRHALRPGGLAA